MKTSISVKCFKMECLYACDLKWRERCVVHFHQQQPVLPLVDINPDLSRIASYTITTYSNM